MFVFSCFFLLKKERNNKNWEPYAIRTCFRNSVQKDVLQDVSPPL